MQLAGFRAEGFRLVVRCWISSGCAQSGLLLFDFVTIRAAGSRRKSFAKQCTGGFRRDVGCWVYSGCALLDSVGIELIGLRRDEFRPAAR